MIGFVLFWMLLVVLSVPMAFSLAIAATAFLLLQGQDPYIIVQRMIAGPDSFPLLAVPFFILAGNLMNSTGITRRLFNFARVLVGHIPGGLGHVNVLASVIFAGMSGSAVADAAGLGVMEIEAMVAEGYDPDFSAAITAASATIGPIIPPSIPMVLFGVLSGTSVGSLFLGGFIPGLIMGAGLMVGTYIIGVKRGYKVDRKPSIREVWVTFREAFLALLTPVIIMGGIVAGIFTPTEAAIITVMYALLISSVVYRSVGAQQLLGVIVDSIEFTANIMIIVAAANLFGWVITRENVPQMLTELLLSFSSNPTVIMLLIAGLVLVLGCVMEGTSMMLILVPILMPTIVRAGISPVHLGVVFVLCEMIGLITPPFAVNLYIVSGIADISFEKAAKATLPFLAILAIVALIVTLFPQLVLFLPELVYQRLWR